MKPEVLIHRLIRRAQQHNRSVGRSRETGLNLAESHLLVELDAQPLLTIGELSTLLMMTQGFTSQLIKNLSKCGLISISSMASDARKKKLSITTKGRGVLKRVDELANESYHRMSRVLSSQEIQSIIWLFRVVADGFGAPRALQRKDEPPYRSEQRRLTRACGFLSDQMFGTPVSSTMWQILGEVTLSPIAPQPGELANLLSLASNSISSIVTDMAERKYLGRRTCGKDRRSVVLYPLPRGERLYSEVESIAAQKIAESLRGMPDHQVTSAVGAFRRFVNDCGEGFPPLLRQQRIEYASAERERQRARGFIAHSLVRDGFAAKIPEHFVSKDSKCYLLRDDNDILAVLEVAADNGVIKCCGWIDTMSPWNLAAFICSSALSGRPTHRDFENCLREFSPLKTYLNARRISRTRA